MNQEKNIFKGISLIQQLPFQHLLTETQKQKIADSSNLVEFIKKEIIFKQGEEVKKVPFIISGLVKIFREMRKGKSIILRISQPGAFLGLSSVFTNDSYNFTVSTLEPSIIGYIDINVFKEIVEMNGLFGYEIVKQLGHENIFNVNRLSSLLYKQLPGRVADIILYFSQEIYRSNTFNIPLTRQELAELAGTTKESLIRTLSEFNHDKIINMNRNNFSIISMNIINTLSRLG
jgi:CRP/FNR family transcriptional regulator